MEVAAIHTIGLNQSFNNVAKVNFRILPIKTPLQMFIHLHISRYIYPYCYSYLDTI